MELAKQFGVSNIPFVAAFRGGKMVQSQVGFSGRDRILELFEELS
jgi:thioredoxin-like negative regulator of GroEL